MSLIKIILKNISESRLKKVLSIPILLFFVFIDGKAYADQKTEISLDSWVIDQWKSVPFSSDVDGSKTLQQSDFGISMSLMHGFGTMGAAHKDIIMRKGFTYNLKIYYMMCLGHGSGYIDFNGERFDSFQSNLISEDYSPITHLYNKTIVAQQDFIYRISLYFKTSDDPDTLNNASMFIGSGPFDKGSITETNSNRPPQSMCSIITKYRDEIGKTILSDVVKTGNIGDDYTTEQKVIKGYFFKEVKGNPIGKFTNQTQTVTYIYNVDQSTLRLKDSTIYTGDSWSPQDNFVSATDVDGNKVDLSSITVDDSKVNISKVGVYDVTYAHDRLTRTAKVMVKDKNKEDKINEFKNENGDQKFSIKKSNKNGLPKTGVEETPIWITLFGSLSIISSLGIFLGRYKINVDID